MEGYQAQTTKEAKKFVVVGKLEQAYRLKGQLRLNSYCSNPIDITKFPELFTQDNYLPIKIKCVKETQKHLIVEIKDITSREKAERLQHTLLFAKRDDFPSLDEEEFYFTDLEGLKVMDTSENNLGTIVSVHNYGANDLLEIKLNNQSDTVFLPFTKTNVISIEISSNRIVIQGIEEFC